MSHTIVKTTFEQQADAFGGTEVIVIICHHNHSADHTTFFYEDGSIVEMSFQKWSVNGRDKWDAMIKLDNPFVGEWGISDLKEGVEYCSLPEKIF